MRRLMRPRHDRVIAGVCAGIAQYFNIDPVVVRVVWVLLTLPGFIHGIIIYLVLWVVMPSEE